VDRSDARKIRVTPITHPQLPWRCSEPSEPTGNAVAIAAQSSSRFVVVSFMHRLVAPVRDAGQVFG
jgi:hypothetical protein